MLIIAHQPQWLPDNIKLPPFSHAYWDPLKELVAVSRGGRVNLGAWLD